MGVTNLVYGRKAIDVQWCTRWRRVKNEVDRYKERMLVKVHNLDRVFFSSYKIEILLYPNLNVMH